MGTVRVGEVEVSAEDDIGTVRVSGVAVEVDAPESTGVFRVSGVAVETDVHVTGTFRVARVTLETGELPDSPPAWFWGAASGKWRPLLAYAGTAGEWL